MTESAAKLAGPDWERIEADYRAGVLSLREIAARDGSVSEGAIRKRAKKCGWSRDLAARIQAKADELVRREAVRTDGTQLRTASPAAEKVIVEANAQAVADIRLAHRNDISRARRLCLAMAEELEALTGERLTVERLRELIEVVDDETQDAKAIERARAILEKAMSLPMRAGTLKQLTDSLKTLVTLEREAWQVDKDGGGATYDDLLAELYGEGNG